MELMTFIYALLLLFIVPFNIWLRSKSGQRWLNGDC